MAQAPKFGPKVANPAAPKRVPVAQAEEVLTAPEVTTDSDTTDEEQSVIDEVFGEDDGLVGAVSEREPRLAG